MNTSKMEKTILFLVHKYHVSTLTIYS